MAFATRAGEGLDIMQRRPAVIVRGGSSNGTEMSPGGPSGNDYSRRHEPAAISLVNVAVRDVFACS